MFLLRDLVSPRTWLAMTHHLAGVFTGLVAFIFLAVGLSTGLSLVVVALAGLPILGITIRLSEWFAQAERARFGLLLGARIPAWPASDSPGRAGYRWGIVPRWRMFTERATWCVLGYALLRCAISAVTVTFTFLVWSAALVTLTLPSYSTALPAGGPEFGSTVLRGTPTMTAAVAIGFVLLLAAPQLTRAMAAMDTAISRRLLGPRRDLAARVDELERSRERVVDAAVDERRRIERDLHDGAQ
jgi:signal transduction histidine kinase